MPGADEPITITADTVTWLRNDNTLDLLGSVVVEHPDYLITADAAHADLTRKTITARGHVTVTYLKGGVPRQVLAAEEVQVQTDQATGWVVKGRLTVPWHGAVFQFSGGRIQRIDGHTYLIEQGDFTWCACEGGEPPDWSVSADRIEADVSGDAVVRGGRVRIRNHPLFAVPYFRYPIGTERRTGFLMPVIETTSSDGFQIEEPFYWVISPSADLTLGPRWIWERGINLGAEVRYDYGDLARGTTRGFVIDDGKEHAWRGGIRIIHRTDAGDIFSAASDLALVSANEDLFDFPYRDLGDENQRALESRLYLSYHWPYMNLTAELAAFDDLMGGDLRSSPFGNDRDQEMVQRLPAVTYTLLTRPLFGPLLFDVSGYAVNYYRQDVEAGRGQLITLMPRVALPWRIAGAVDFWMDAGFREWFVAPDQAFNSTSTYTGRPEADLYLSAQWERIFENGGRRYRHVIRPELVGFYAGAPDEPADAFFQTILPGRATQLLGVRLDSRLYSRPASARPSPIAETARIELTQLYDFEDESWRDLRIEAGLGAPTPWRVNLDAYHSWEEWEWSRIEAGAGYIFDKNTQVRVGYRKDTGNVRSPYFDFQSVPDESVSGGIKVKPGERHELEYRAFYSIQHDRMVRQSLDWDYVGRQKCWGVHVNVTDRIRPSRPEGHDEISGSVNLRLEAP
ncbi:MAG TPA: LPS assembly protein LptD [bacterium]|nr:LPS assembly protein LptD [bacterium]